MTTETLRYKYQHARPSLTVEQCEAVATGQLRLLGPDGPLVRPLPPLALEEWLYAKRFGYVHATDKVSNALSFVYRRYCEAVIRPCVVVSPPRGRRCEVLLDMYTCLDNLTPAGCSAIEGVLRGFTRNGKPLRRSIGTDLVRVEGVDPDCADGLAVQLYEIATGGLVEGLITPIPYAGKRDGLPPPVQSTATTEVSTVEHDPKVQFFKEGDSFATVTSAIDADEFLAGCARVLPAALALHPHDEEFQLDGLLPQVCMIWAKLRGYKADGVFEQRLLIAGTPNPGAHMQLMVPAVPPATNGHAEPASAPAPRRVD